jgi:hypothetical protein
MAFDGVEEVGCTAAGSYSKKEDYMFPSWTIYVLMLHRVFSYAQKIYTALSS